MGDIINSRLFAVKIPISRMTLEMRQSLLINEPLSRLDVPIAAIPSPIPMPPSSYNWSNVEGKSYVTPVKYQVGPTCVAFANTAALESLVLRTISWEGDDIDLSEHALVSCNDGYPGIISEFLASTGIPPESCYPSDAETWNDVAPCEDWQEKTYKIVNHYPFKNPRVNDIKSLLLQFGPLVAGMNVPPDFFDWGPGCPDWELNLGVYHSKEFTNCENCFHEVLIVGYDDFRECFIVKNSWGKEWCEDGFFKIAYNENDTPVCFGRSLDAFSGVITPFVPGQKNKLALLGSTADKRLITLILGENDCIYQACQTSPNNGWSPWTRLGKLSDKAKYITIETNDDGRLEVFVIGVNDEIFHIWQITPNNGWGSWATLGSEDRAKYITSTKNADGRLEIFYVGTNNKLYHNWQIPGGWNGEEWLGTNDYAKQIAVGQNMDGRLEVVYIGTNDKIYHNWQITSGWHGEELLGSNDYAKQITIGQNVDGYLEIVYIGTNNRLFHNWQTPEGWHGESALGASARQVVVDRYEDGRLAIFYIGTNGKLYHNWQTSPRGRWIGEIEFGGSAKQITVNRHADGRLEVFYIGLDDKLYHNYQTAPNVGWIGEILF